jgi:ABC transport system ATP-binding/permease protein
LLKLLITNPNFLILDEPTNDFDIDTLNVLEDFLTQFSGCLLLVSHDRYFMDHLVDQLFIFEGEGKVRHFNGNYTDYRDWLDDEEVRKTARTRPAEKIEKETVRSVEKKKASFREKQEYEKLQQEIDNLESRKTELSQLLNSGSADHQKLQEWAQEVARINDLVEEKTVRWLELAELIDS